MQERSYMLWWQSIFFILFFIAPHTIASITPKDYQWLVMTIVVVGYFFLFICHPQITKKLFTNFSLIIILWYILCVGLKFYAYNKLNIYSALMPISAFWGYYFISAQKLNLKYFHLFIIFLYIYYIATYFVYLPSLFFREEFDDGSWYEVSSSNSIPIALINSLYIYMIISYFQNEKQSKYYLFFSLVNLILVLIQGSRIGVFLSLLFLLYSIYMFFKERVRSKNLSKLMFSISVVSILIVLITFYSIVDAYLNHIDFFSETNVRLDAVNNFISNLNDFRFFFGYPPGYVFTEDVIYTYNVWLDHWNNCTIFGLFALLILFFRRIIFFKEYFFPLYMFIPFFIYSWIEPRYLPGYWDFFIYLMLFYKRDYCNNYTNPPLLKIK